MVVVVAGRVSAGVAMPSPGLSAAAHSEARSPLAADRSHQPGTSSVQTPSQPRCHQCHDYRRRCPFPHTHTPPSLTSLLPAELLRAIGGRPHISRTAPAVGPSTSRPRPPRLIWPPLRPADRASSEVHSCAVPFWWAARPPLLAISRCFSGDIDAKPRRSLRSPFTIRPFAASFIAALSLGHPSGFRHQSRPAVAALVLPADPGREQVSVRRSECRACGPVLPAGVGLVSSLFARAIPSTLRATVGLHYQSLCHELPPADGRVSM